MLIHAAKLALLTIGAALLCTALAYAGDCSGPSDCAAIPDNVCRVGGLTAVIGGVLYVCKNIKPKKPPVEKSETGAKPDLGW